MTQAIRDAISLMLATAFPQCKVYGDERVRQGLESPSFFVSLREGSVRPLPNRLMEQTQAVEVIYFPEQQGNQEELWSMGAQVAAQLAELCFPDGSAARGRGLRCDTNDGLMYIRASYTLRLKPSEPHALMGELEIRNA